jgi:hypothetical protein
MRVGQKRSIVGLARGEEFSRFVDERLNAPDSRSQILSLHMERSAFVFNLDVKSCHLPPIILACGDISSFLGTILRENRPHLFLIKARGVGEEGHPEAQWALRGAFDEAIPSERVIPGEARNLKLRLPRPRGLATTAEDVS